MSSLYTGRNANPCLDFLMALRGYLGWDATRKRQYGPDRWPVLKTALCQPCQRVWLLPPFAEVVSAMERKVIVDTFKLIPFEGMPAGLTCPPPCYIVPPLPPAAAAAAGGEEEAKSASTGPDASQAEEEATSGDVQRELTPVDGQEPLSNGKEVPTSTSPPRGSRRSSTATMAAPLHEPPACSGEALRKVFHIDASLLHAVCTLGVKPGDKVLDVSAGSGGASLVFASQMFGTFSNMESIAEQPTAAAAATLANRSVFDGTLVVNEPGNARLKAAKLRRSLEAHLPSELTESRNLQFTSCDIFRDPSQLERMGPFDKIFFSASSTADGVLCQTSAAAAAAASNRKQAIAQRDATFAHWTSGASKRLVEEVSEVLLDCCTRLLRPGGFLLYCSHSVATNENDGVVETLMQKLAKQEISGCVSVEELSLDSAILGGAGKEQTSFGQMITSDRNKGYAPMYLCFLKRN